MGKFLLDGTTGSSYTKKRKRVKGADHNVRREVKQFNPFVNQNDSLDNYGSFYMSNIYDPNKTGETEADIKFGSWYPIVVNGPRMGTGKSERIGNQYFMKYMRFLGYIAVTGYVYRDMNWRLVLYRSCNGPLFASTDTTYAARTDALLNHVYKNIEGFSQISATRPAQNFARHNFYKKIVNVDSKDVYSRKVIASGTIPKSWDGTVVSQRSFGSTSGFIEGLQSDFLIGDGRRYLPLDIKVTCNDWIKDQEVFYYIALECDSVNGLDIKQMAQSVFPTVTESNVYSKSCFVFNLFCRGYFVDP